jgi:DNA-binding MarR family transcriptional regulator
MAADERNVEGVMPLTDLDRMIHEPARLMLMSYLSVLEGADFLFLMRQTGMTQGNLSSHLSKLEQAGYIEIQKTFVGKKPRTMVRATAQGREAFHDYRERMERILEESKGE